MICFYNKGNIDIRAIKTFGVSAKENSKSAIGYFGTGLKYAIAILLRTGHEISIVTGGNRYDFSLTESIIRDQEFKIVTMTHSLHNEEITEELAFTTELGKDWEVWMAYRELYCNMLDETGKMIKYDPSLYDENQTTILVTGHGIEKIDKNRWDYFLDTKSRSRLARNNKVTAYAKENLRNAGLIFYKGVRVAQSPSHALYDYSFDCNLTLTEDRTVKAGWLVSHEIATMVLESKNRDFIEEIVLANVPTWECNLNFETAGTVDDSSVFIDVVGKLRKRLKDTSINTSAVAYHKKVTKIASVLPLVSIQLTDVEATQLDRALMFCQNTLMLNVSKFDLIVCEDLGSPGQLGRADIRKGIMYISRQCFREGTKRIAVALLEEYTHCEHRVRDETVEQKWIYLNQIISLGEELRGDPL